MNFKAIFFDNDGLLVDTEPLCYKATQEIFASVGLEIPLDWYIHESLDKGRSSFELARENGISEEDISALRHRRNKIFGEMLAESVQPIDGVVKALEMLQGKILMGVVTSGRKDHFDIIMKKTGLRHFFSFFITADDVKDVKPDPEPYLKAIELSGQEKKNCIAMEDSPRGVVAAKAAGITCYAIPDDLTRTGDFSIADKVLNSIRELPDLLLVR